MCSRSLCATFSGYSLICVWTGILFFQNNSARFAWDNFSFQLGMTIFLCVALWLIGIGAAVAPSWIWPQWSVTRAFSVWIIGIFLVFVHDAIRYLLKDKFHLTELPSQGVYLLTVILTLILVWLTSCFGPCRWLLSMAAALLTLISLGSLMPLAWNHLGGYNESEKLPDGVQMTGERRLNNVYYVILDSYGGASALRKHLQYDISSFLEKMTSLGYINISSARTNYTATYVSLAATLNMEYILNEESRRYLDRSNLFPSLLYQTRPPALTRVFQSKGYNFIHIGNGWAPCLPANGILCLPYMQQTSFQDIFTRYLAPTRLVQVYQRIQGTGGMADIDALTPFSKAVEDIATQSKPSFVFVHHLIPHEPRHIDCTRSYNDLSEDEYKNSIECTNRSVVALAERIYKADPDAIVVFQADHGSGFQANWKSPLVAWTNSAVDERRSILNLVHIPVSCQKWVRQDLSPINTTRLVLACLDGRAPEYLVERTYLVAYELSPDFGLVRDVTNLVP